MQNLGPAQVETLYKNTGEGDSLCDGMTAESLGVTTMVKGMVTCEQSQNPWLTAGSSLLTQNASEQQEAYTGRSPRWQKKHFDPPNLTSRKNGIPTGAQPLLLARMQVSLQDDVISSTLICYF